VTRELKRIEPKSVVRIAFFLGLLCGFLFGIYSSYVMKEISRSFLSPEDAAALGGLTGSSVLMTGFLMSLMGSLFFSVMGWVLSAAYNFLASRFGGIEYTVAETGNKEEAIQQTHIQSRDDDDE
jgi:hypothetical protein